MKGARLLVAMGALGALSVPAFSDVVTVYVYDFEYTTDPTLATQVDPVIQVGDTVRWEWVHLGHDVRSLEGSPEVFSSGFMDEVGDTFEHTFTNVGTFWYYCTPHGFDNGDGTAQGMAGTVTVQPVPEPGTWAALAVGGAALLRRSRRNQRRRVQD